MTYFDVETSIESAAPAELYTFQAPATTWRITTFESDVVFSGNTYSAVTGSRSNLTTGDVAGDSNEVTIELPALHALPQQYANGVPMKELLVTIVRYHPASGVSLQLWQGYVSELSFKGRMAQFKIPSGTGDALGIAVPSVCAQRLCNNILYDGQCQIARASFQVVTTITSISADGRTITIAGTIPAAVNNVAWAVHGEILHSTSQERRTITVQPSLSQVTLQGPFPNGVITVGDAVTVFAGCDHQLTTCKAKFNNVLNFEGFPYLPGSNLFYVGLMLTRYH